MANTALDLSLSSTQKNPLTSLSDSGLKLIGASQRLKQYFHKMANQSPSSKKIMITSTVSTQNYTTEWLLSSAISTVLKKQPTETNAHTNAAFTRPSFPTSNGKITTLGIDEQPQLT